MKELKSIQTCAPMRDVSGTFWLRTLLSRNLMRFFVQGIFSVTLNDDNLFEWDVKVRKWDEESLLAFDMMKMKKQYGICDIWIRISFPDNFPFDPPYVLLFPLHNCPYARCNSDLYYSADIETWGSRSFPVS